MTSNSHYGYLRLCQRCCLLSFEWCMLALGPILIVTVILLASCESYWTLVYILPLFAPNGWRWWLHATWVFFLAVNGLFNYFMCVSTDPGTSGSKLYLRLVVEACEGGQVSVLDLDEYCDKNGFKMPALKVPRRAPNNRRRPSSWLDRGPYEWGFCKQTQAPKAPRSHYDHVTNKLVLNMDHYCPWMFNVVGYANYRYFVLFLFWVTVACAYGAAITAQPFIAMAWPAPHRRIWRPKSKQARSAVTFTCVLAVSVGAAVFVLFSWHAYLVATCQTTIEFYGNATLRHRARSRGLVFRNPYDRGCRRNWQHVFGRDVHPLLATLPSFRPPPSRPWPEPEAPTTQVV